MAAIAVEKGCPRLQWEVLDWNTPAIDFYRAMGAEFLDEWRNVRVERRGPCPAGRGPARPSSSQDRLAAKAVAISLRRMLPERGTQDLLRAEGGCP